MRRKIFFINALMMIFFIALTGFVLLNNQMSKNCINVAEDNKTKTELTKE